MLGHPVAEDKSRCNCYAKQKHPGCKESARPIRRSIVNRYVCARVHNIERERVL